MKEKNERSCVERQQPSVFEFGILEVLEQFLLEESLSSVLWSQVRTFVGNRAVPNDSQIRRRSSSPALSLPSCPTSCLHKTGSETEHYPPEKSRAKKKGLAERRDPSLEILALLGGEKPYSPVWQTVVLAMPQRLIWAVWLLLPDKARKARGRIQLGTPQEGRERDKIRWKKAGSHSVEGHTQTSDYVFFLLQQLSVSCGFLSFVHFTLCSLLYWGFPKMP